MFIALCGKPSVGKSTFFKASTLADVKIANYPFTTLKSSEGMAFVKIDCIDKEFNTRCNPQHGYCVDSKRFVPIKLVDIPGLIEGSHKGLGMGNEFLNDITQADALIHVIDVSGSTNEKGEEVEKGSYNPSNDIKFLETELDLWYHNILMKVWKTFARKAEMGNINFSEAVARQFSGLKVKEEQVKKVLQELNLSEKPSSWDDKQIMGFASALRKESKPMIIAANKIDTEKGRVNYEKLRAKFPNLSIVPCSADSELALREAAKAKLIDYVPGDKDFKIIGKVNDSENEKFSGSESLKNTQKLSGKQKQALDKIRETVLEKFEYGTGVQQILNSAVFDLLNYIAIFPASANKLGDSKGNILPDCFLLPKGSTALDFAYFLHTDFGENFIKAIDARTKRALGKAYELKHRDALEIITR
ncbi:MAG TPA: TGS domain-containing protein [Candidatus Pacearchaeota archaeon]|nr:ribosome-binding ATPase YchF [archaeon BMS3Abin17]HDK42605.1 TGS domain-containing protein [Candidatus Pacearchaeota archaeon]